MQKTAAHQQFCVTSSKAAGEQRQWLCGRYNYWLDIPYKNGCMLQSERWI
jgi:hypothetical protein